MAVQIPIKLTDRFAVVDDGDAALAQFEWRLHPQGYAYRKQTTKPRNIYLHRVVIGANPGQIVDHINRDPLDNRRSNLRICTKTENIANSPAGRGASRFKGVSWGWKRWRAVITVNRRQLALGVYDREEDAARAYDAAALQHFGPLAHTNFP